MMKTRLFTLLATVLLASGRASNKMIDSEQQELIAPSEDKAQIVFQKWLKSTEFSENTPASRTWADENRSNILGKKADYEVVWKQKSVAELAERTLNPQDGV